MASMHQATGYVQSFPSDRLDRNMAVNLQRLAALRVIVDTEYAQSLSSLIETEIIPRLMVAHTATALTADIVATDPGIDALEIEAFAPMVMAVEADVLLAHVESILARGVSLETLMVDFLAPTARLLGEFWEADRCDFVDVTMGLWRMQEVVHEIATQRQAERASTGGGRSALFVTMPGDQHSFGTVVIEELFRRDGWVTDRLSEVESADLMKRVASDWFDLIGLTVSCDCHMADLASVIVALRSVSRNARVCVMVGGRIFSADPDLAAQVGADGTARDAKLALKVAVDLVREREAGAAALS
ncbi:cobalamin B12-binding domain-containing protein [Polymorphobacter arshaanensis]|uniref:Cobalamin B12-binding domain-containing protein n=1 Tax=Glacieibacterium arshaanense TaxID=2511025 RepID=A0A4Y9EP13_9SPHN|nr:cobalamin B12-binding domain-containing protein [Polymorphobacter arshaanensis]TFU03099.1 cobalamin B12-binding domain-containing protein [Polymorphobacter arshaanensis]